MKGDVFPYKPVVYQDKGVSPQVTRVTSIDFTCNHLYFTNCSFTPDDKKIIFESEMGGGNNLYMMDLEKEQITQLTEGYNLDYFPHPSRDGKYVFFGQGRYVRTVNLETLEEKIILDANPLVGREVTKCSATFPSYDGKKLINFFEADPEYGFIVTNLETGESKVILRSDQPVRHCQFCPTDNDLILYAHEGKSKDQTRMWLIQSDGSNNRRVRAHADGDVEHCFHESWSHHEKVVFFTIRKRLEPGMPTYFAKINLDTGEETILFPLDNFHCSISHDDSMIVGDNQVGDRQIHIIKIETQEILNLCYPNMSFIREMSRFHPHPTFNYKGDKVIYSTDGFGRPGVFVADVPKFK